MNQRFKRVMYAFGLIFSNSLFSDVALASSQIHTISCDDLQNEMQLSISNEGGLYVINVLPKAICTDCKIPGTLNIPFDKLSKKVQSWPKNREIVIHCAGLECPLGRYACELLHRMGFSKVRLFDGGIRTWKSKNLPTTGACKAGYLKG